jgi:hypothetical protein
MTPAMNLSLVTMAPKGGRCLSRDMGGLVGSKVVKLLENGLVLFSFMRKCCRGQKFSHRKLRKPCISCFSRWSLVRLYRISALTLHVQYTSSLVNLIVDQRREF